MGSLDYSTQDATGVPPIAVVSFACRLPGGNNDPETLWRFLENGKTAPNTVPESRFASCGHYDGSKRSKTMKGRGGMFLGDVDLARFDAPFFNISAVEARAMDPQQRQLLEVVYESLENGGLTLDGISGQQVGCFVSSFTVDYLAIQNRDPDARPRNMTTGTKRSILSNRISYYFNLKGPSVTIDTACSGGLTAVDLACRYLGSNDISAAIVAASHLFLNPDDLLEDGQHGSVYSPDGLCQVFDTKANGYVKAEAVNAVILKRLDDALADGDPIRAIIRGSASNSNGATVGISTPSMEQQVACIRAAYARAGITDTNATSYIECHGTGTQAGDPIEVSALSAVFGPTRDDAGPLIIGSVKSNLGHSEPAAGLSGVIKAVMAIERAKIPGQTTFSELNPKINLAASKLFIPKKIMTWPDVPIRRASVNSFGFGGANAHVILEEPKGTLGVGWSRTHVLSQGGEPQAHDFSSMKVGTASKRLYTMVFSAAAEEALRAYYTRLKRHLADMNVKVRPSDLAYTLSQRRTHHSCRAYAVTSASNLNRAKVEFGEKPLERPRMAFVFTGQGSQWPQMGAGLVQAFPCAAKRLQYLDTVLQSTSLPPSWSLIRELTEPREADYYQRPEISQPLTTALQLAILSILEEWGVVPLAVVGHSSGEIAAAYAVGHLSLEQAILAAFYRGQAAAAVGPSAGEPLGMLAVGAGPENVQALLPTMQSEIQIACFNSPNSVTLSGPKSALIRSQAELEQQGCFARMLRVDLAYHSSYVAGIAKLYKTQLEADWFKYVEPSATSPTAQMFSSVTGGVLDRPCDSEYWRANMTSPVLFASATSELFQVSRANLLLEIGPSGALAGPIRQILDGIAGGQSIQYLSALHRGRDAAEAMHELAGKLYVADYPLCLRAVNFPAGKEGPTDPGPAVIVDLPNYSWDHSTPYWHESESSRDWRFGQYPYHELLGRKLLGSPWTAPSWKCILRLDDLAWLKDHQMAGNAVFPAAGYLAMAIQGIFQARQSVNPIPNVALVSELQYVLRDVQFRRALALDSDKDPTIMLVFTDPSEGYTSWTGFRVLSILEGSSVTHCNGSICVRQSPGRAADKETLAPLQHSESAAHWYRTLDRRGCTYGPDFQRLIDIECLAGQYESRATISLEPPSTGSHPQMYCLHPALIDICFQSVFPAIYRGLRSELKSLLLPSSLDELTVGPIVHSTSDIALAVAHAAYTGTGPKELGRNQYANASVWSMKSSQLLLEFSGLRFSELNIDDGATSDPELFAPVWLPDLEFLSQDALLSILRPEAALSDLINLVAFKKPRLRVGEINLTTEALSSAWFAADGRGLREAYEHYTYVDADPARLTAVRGLVGHRANAEFKLLVKDASSFFPDPQFDLILVHHQDSLSPAQLSLLGQPKDPQPQGQPLYLFLQHPSSTPCAEDIDNAHLQQAGIEVQFRVPINGTCFAHLCRNPKPPIPTPANKHDGQVVSIISFQRRAEAMDSLSASLSEAGYRVQVQSSFGAIGDDVRAAIVLDDFSSPLLADVSDEYWLSIRQCLLEGAPCTVWVTQGAQFQATNPNNALIHGLLRSVRAENPSVKLITLDVEGETPAKDSASIVQVLDWTASRDNLSGVDCEFVQRGGILHVSRVLRQVNCEEFYRGHATAPSTEFQSIHDNVNHVQLGVTHVGSLDSLQLYEVPGGEPSPLPDQVEIEVTATGLNFKDVAVSTGLVPGDDHALGLEAAGVVTKVGRHVYTFRPGDKVAFMDRGAFTNRARISYKRVQRVPDGMALAVAAALPVVYMTAIYALVNIANLRRGQSVLIHSGAGGVGIAAIQLAQYLQAEIYVTVGSEDKRVFLQENLNIPPSRIFSSRNTEFAEAILAATKGKGAEVILNSVTGELLDETWRICAEGGIMVDIGRGLRNQCLAAAPFERNCSVKAFDLMHKQISDDLIQNLFSHTFDLFRKRHLQVVHPIRIFPYAEIQSAFDLLSTGRHIGKIVVSDEAADGRVPSAVSIQPAPPVSVIRRDRAYLIAGGLHGIGGTLAIYLALRGARHIVIVSRSGCSTSSRGKWIVETCRRLGCEITDARGDVTSYESVKAAFMQSPVPICGIIHGAMVLHDKPYELMDANSYRQCIAPKLQGAWNLHQAAADLKLDLEFFTLLSSISGVIGQNGQANYAAANCFLDSFASYRRSLGLPALSLDLGAVRDIGVAMENPVLLDYFSDPQWISIEQGELFHIMDASIQHQLQQKLQKPQHGGQFTSSSSPQLIMALAYPLPPQSELLADIRFSALPRTSLTAQPSQNIAAAAESQAVTDFLVSMRNSGGANDATALTAAAIELFQSQLSRMLRVDGPIKANKPLSAYGMDSLSAVKLRNWVERSFQVTFAVFEILGANGLQALCSKLVTKLQVTS